MPSVPVAAAFAALVILGGGLARAGYSPQDEAAFKSIRPDEVAALARARGPEWLAKVTSGQSRICYDNAEWQAKIDEVRALSGPGARWRQRLIDAADRIVSAADVVDRPARLGDAQGWQRTYGDSLVCLAAAAKIWPRPVYAEKLKRMVLAGCRFPTWGNDGSRGESRNMDLAAGHMARGLAIAYDWHRDLYSPAEVDLIRQTFRTRIPYLMRGLYGAVFWSHWYSQNHNHVSVAGLGIAGAAFLGEIPEATDWLAASVIDFQRVGQAMPPDGGIYEGVLYWGYGRSFILQYIEATKNITGLGSLYNRPFLRNTAAFRVNCSTPGLNAVLLWADCRGYDGIGPQHLLYRIAAQYGDGLGQDLANSLPNAPQSPDSIAWTLLWYDPAVRPVKPQALDYQAENWGVVNSRSGWGAGDYLLSFKAGFNRNHHTKTDAGALSLNFGGEWLLMAPGYGLGGGSPGFFDEQTGRWIYFSNRAESHSTLIIDGQNQRSDPAARGIIDHDVASPSVLLTEADLTAAYAGVREVRRRILHRRGDYILVVDHVSTPESAKVEWLAQVPPSAQADGRTLRVAGMHGSLALTVLADGSDFSRRAPQASVVDVSPSWMTTFGSQASGTDVQLATLLQPTFRDEPAAPLAAVCRKTETGSVIVIDGPGWQDETWIHSPGMPLGFKAELLSVRRRGAQVLSWIASGALEAQAPGFRFHAEAPVDLACERAPHGGACVTIAGPFAGSLQLGQDLQLFGPSGQAIGLTGPIKLASGRYFVARDAPAARRIGAWAAGLFPPRPASPTLAVRSLPMQPTLASTDQITWKAAKGVVQENGLATASQIHRNPSGEVLLDFGSESPAHRIGWTVAVAHSGMYELVLRYAAGQPLVRFAVTVDGAAPTQFALACSLPGPPGWGTERYFKLNAFDWRTRAVTDESGTPLQLALSAGRHEIGLAEPSSGINLDTLTLTGAGR